MDDWNPYYSEAEEHALTAKQQAEAMDRHTETVAILALSRRARGLHNTPIMEAAIDAVSPAASIDLAVLSHETPTS